jgi:zinc/manganese transport system permease protein
VRLLAAEPKLTWNLIADVRQLLEFPFMVNALRAGTIVAVTAGVVGWFMVLRRQTFAGHTLALIGFPGAAGAILLGLSPQIGFFAFCVGGALVIGAAPGPGSARLGSESALIGMVQAFALASGFLFVTLYRGNLNGVNSLLFGTFLGVTVDRVVVLFAVSAVALGLLASIGRPLLFASVDPEVAAGRGVAVRSLSLAFLVLLGVAAAETSQITGSLLIFALLVLPPATAQTITARPAASVVLSVILAVAVTWVGIGVAYYSPYPIGFWVTTIAFALFAMARAGAAVGARLALTAEPAP